MSQNTNLEGIPLFCSLIRISAESRIISVFFIRFEYYDHIDMSNTLTVTDVNEASSMMAIVDIYRSMAKIFTVTAA